jgi:hypothetical protein
VSLKPKVSWLFKASESRHAAPHVTTSQTFQASSYQEAGAILMESLRLPILHRLVAINLLFILVHVVVAAMPSEDAESWTGLLRIDRDRSLSEWFESVELLGAILLLVPSARKRQRGDYHVVAVILAFMLLDNLLELREFVALLVAPGNQAMAEIVMVGAVAPVFTGLAIRVYRRADAPAQGELSAIFLVLVLFGMFAVVSDFLHEILTAKGSLPYAALSVIEDGGELVTLSLLLAIVIRVTRQAGDRVTRGSET